MITFFRVIFAPPRHLILSIAALWLGLALAEKRVEQHRISKEALNSIIYYSILGYIIGGRMFFAAANLSAFTRSPLSIFSINVDLFDPTAALITAMLVGLAYGRRHQLPFWSTLDAVTPLFAILMVALPLAHLAAGTAFGSPMGLPWGISLWNAVRHPVQIYDFIAAVFIFGWIWFRRPDTQAGSDFISFSALTAAARLFTEAFRGDSTLIFDGLRLAQIVAWSLLAAALVTYEVVVRKENSE